MYFVDLTVDFIKAAVSATLHSLAVLHTVI